MVVSPDVRIQQADFEIADEVANIRDSGENVGAIVTFSGICRDEGGTLSALELEHYPGMAENQITEIAEQAIKRWSLKGLTVVHRYGKIEVGSNIVLVVAASPHRQDAFDGANFLMDFLKTRAPFWKKEHLKDGTAGQWVSARDEDYLALDRWQ